ncbi:MAG: hypothetical protein ACTS22_01120 [Phycisphaerales bacterium]
MTGTPLDIVGLAGAAADAARVAGRLAGRAPGAEAFADIFGRSRQLASSGEPVTLGEGVEAELTTEQLDRLALAADRASAQGAQIAVVMLDGVAYELDVTARRVTGVVDREGGIRPEIDTFLFAPDLTPAQVGPPSGGVRNQSVADLLAARSGE